MEPKVTRQCHVLMGNPLILLTFGIGYCAIVGTCFDNFLLVIAGLFLGWVGLFYCVGNASIWG
ncbi:hypothetical protein SAMN04488556_3317 [Halostagnicola kamekurae]|uniref:Uncharacterized protein n=1 Tax=Halostagnicola kamekurae TaxID=619731 RepID=A0A1I6TQD7_9EURY|nr:hypothetical protein [Halostagnicola kamekurae]SFS91452.1 hypothetical protein SAMN04488556_3317 [Halostagnicola kamekurae]